MSTSPESTQLAATQLIEDPFYAEQQFEIIHDGMVRIIVPNGPVGIVKYMCGGTDCGRFVEFVAGFEPTRTKDTLCGPCQVTKMMKRMCKDVKKRNKRKREKAAKKQSCSPTYAPIGDADGAINKN